MAQLYFKYGAMGSSKTANALMARFNYEERGQKTLLCKPQLDTRDGDHMVYSRIGLKHPCIYFDEMRGHGGTQIYSATPASSSTRPSSSPRRRSIIWCIWWTTAASPSSATACGRTSRASCSRAATTCWCWRTSWRRSRPSAGAARSHLQRPVRCCRQGAEGGRAGGAGANDQYIGLCRKHWMAGDLGPDFRPEDLL